MIAAFIIGYIIGGVTGIIFMSVFQMAHERGEDEDDTTGRKL